MNEIKEIIRTFDEASTNGIRCALATVVAVEGSSYRRPGARMLITEDGQLTGAISGGCLEGDALNKAIFAIQVQENKLVTYDSTNEDDIVVGLHLGCNGIVHILFEPLDTRKINNPLELLRKIYKSGQSACLITVFSSKNRIHAGTTTEFNNQLTEEIKQCFSEKHSLIKKIEIDKGSMTALIDFIAPPTSLVVAGAGNDVKPLIEIAAILGWSTTVVDGRYHYAISKRFPKADLVLYAKPERILDKLKTNAHTVFLLMTHNYNYDLAFLKELAISEFGYIGILGPAQKRDRMLKDLSDAGIRLGSDQLNKIHGPVGLDIGAENATEIALSILSEIKAFFSGVSGGSLRKKNTAIHNRLLTAEDYRNHLFQA
jgi:xanthine dehydrogenase accessory factor